MSTVSKQVLSEALLDKTMRLFWERGYFNTSIGDLIEVTGFNRAALYKHFGGKHGLFIAMLQRFRTRVVEDATKPLVDVSQGMNGLRTFFTQFLTVDGKMASSHGCFLIATASNLPSHDPEVAEVIVEFIDYLRALFTKNIRYMQAEGDLSQDLDSAVVSDFLVGNVIGLMTMFRASADQRMIQHHVQGVLDYLVSLPVGRREHTRLHVVR